LTFNCSDSFTFNRIENFGLSNRSDDETNNQANCLNFTSSMIIYQQRECNLERWLNNLILEKCKGKSYCETSIDTSSITNPDQCRYDPNANKYFYLSYSCYDDSVDIYNYSIARKNMAWVVASIDLVSITCILICIIVIYRYQNTHIRIFEQKYKLISHYTVYLKHMNLSSKDIASELNHLIDHIEKNVFDKEKNILPKNVPEEIISMNQKEAYSDTIIYEINYPSITDTILQLLLQKRKHQLDLEHYNTKLATAEADNLQKRVKEYKEKVNKLTQELKEIELKMTKEHKNEEGYIDDVFITFTKKEHANLMFRKYNKNCCSRCCLIFCCQGKKIKPLYFKNKWIEMIDNPDEPSNIHWQNMSFHPFRRFIRKLFTIISAIILIVAGLAVIAGGSYLQRLVEQKFDTNLNCKYIQYSKESAMEESRDESIQGKNKVKTTCYCKDYYAQNGYSKTLTFSFDVDDSKTPCKNWMESYYAFQGISYAIVLAVPLINIILQKLLKFMTPLERNKSKTEDRVSNVSKIGFSTVINTAISILIINTFSERVKQWNPDFPFLTGLYSDFNPGWFKNIGSTIVFTMILNILTPWADDILYAIWIFLRRCCDSCSLTGKGSKRYTRKGFNALYLGPEIPLDNFYAGVIIS
jgi:hypothetical protein